MKFATAILTFLSGGAVALSLDTQNETSCSPVSLNAKTNIWRNYTLNINPFYRDKVLAAAEAINDEDLKKQALKVAGVGTFLWMDNVTELAKIEKAISNVSCQNIVGIVLQGLNTGADCATPRFRTLDLGTYQKDYVDPLATTLKAHPNTAFALIIEPYTLPAIIMNNTLPTCQGLATSYYRPGVSYALKILNLPNVVMYIDAGHGGNLGWEHTLKLGADEISAAYKTAGSPSQVRGIAVNTNGYNSWDLSPGEFTSHLEGPPRNYAQNEKAYIQRLTPYLKTVNIPHHAIADMSRSGIAGLRYHWINWCNVDGAGFGRRPGTEGLGIDPDLADAMVWTKSGGVSDGTSDERSPNYNVFCGSPDAFKPSPEKGEWNQAYFETLVRDAKPSFGV